MQILNRIISTEKNCMGTLSIEAKFTGMRKSQEFCTYPIGIGDSKERIKIQSDTRIGYINLTDGIVSLCKPVSGGAYFHHLALAKGIDRLSHEELENLKSKLILTAGKSVGDNALHITTDNSGADKI